MNRIRHRPLKRAIVTGGLGFIGAPLCRRLLAEGTQVLVVDNHLFGRRPSALPAHPHLRVVNMDICDRAALLRTFRRFRPDAVFHLAAIAFIPRCMEDPGTALRVHINGTLNVLEAAKAAKVMRMHFASSAAVYRSDVVLLSEDSTATLPPPDVYSPTKLVGELLYERFYRETGANVVITRCFNVYGPGHTNRFLIPSITGQLREGAKTLALGNLSVARDYIHVDDAVEAILLLMRRTRGLVTVNVGSGKKTTVRELAALCASLVGRRVHIRSDKKHRRPKSVDRPAWQADIRKIRRLVGWVPTRALRDGLEELVSGGKSRTRT